MPSIAAFFSAPASKALLAQAGGWLIVIAALRLGILHPGHPWAVAGVQAASATLLARLQACDRWWLYIHLAFAPMLLATSLLGISPLWFLAAFVLLALFYWSSFRTQVPLFLSNRQTAEAVANLLPSTASVRVLDLGSGTGSLLRPLMALRPAWQGTGVEIAPAPFLLSRLLAHRHPRLHFRRADFWHLAWADYGLVYTFLSPVPMPEVWRKAQREMGPGSLLVSNSFPIPGVEADRVLELPDRRRTRLYIYYPSRDGHPEADAAKRAK